MGLKTYAFADDRESVMSMGEQHRPSLDDVLETLPASYIVAGQQRARLVVGPHGAFVLMPSGSDLDGVADRLHELTAITREAMYAHVTLVPFIDALAISYGEPPKHAPITVAPLDLLTDVMTSGPIVIDTHTLDAIRRAARASTLDGWRVGPEDEQDEIVLRDPATSTTNSH